MSALSVVAGGAWRVAAIVLAALLLVVGTGAGTGWWLATGARDLARADLKERQGVNTELRASIAEQNRAVDGMARETAAAQRRGEEARALAARRGRKLDAAQQQLAGVRATTCDEAMPAVRAMLEAVR
ncbi:hypothetical protein [Janthinobacterium aquaticum]|uniref:hypothetical protein n=1 Tax=Janthinobacterium sp. FT58W TaxID=2654254 RepID=UPI0012642D0B|nr:hypothetical protein [Janthinobacterium sp. FT58W]KAB8042541.1 hypothetical protein GCM43_13535 [Janthinobacterium sp. FT58W]